MMVRAGDKVRLKEAMTSFLVEAGEEGYAAPAEGPGWQVWIARLQRYVPVDEGQMEVVSKYVPPVKIGDGYVYLALGEGGDAKE